MIDMKSENCYKCGRQPTKFTTEAGALFMCPNGHYCIKHYAKTWWQGNRAWNQFMRRKTAKSNTANQPATKEIA